jgi:hypothetical protein
LFSDEESKDIKMRTILRKYGVETTIDFHLFEVDGINFKVDASPGTADIFVMKNEGAEAPSSNAATDEGRGYSLVLTATEMTAARIVLYFEDQTGTKTWLDCSITIETYGHASAMHGFDLNLAALTEAQINAQMVDVLTIDTVTEMSPGAPPASPTIKEILNYIYRLFRNKTLTTATLLTIRNDDDDADLYKATLNDDSTTFTKSEYISG